MPRFRFVLSALSIVSLSLLTLSTGIADEFVIRMSNGKETIQARLAGQARGVLALELPNGELLLTPQQNLVSRKPGDDPPPVTHQEMVEQLTERFGENRFRATISEPFVFGVVLMGDLNKKEEIRLTNFMEKAVRYMQGMQNAFDRFADDLQIELTDSRFPLVVLIFESDDDFERYATEATGQSGIGQISLAGFYSKLTNWLAIRLTECDSFSTPLHEAIHQQVYNRGLYPRLAPVPLWFDEGIATGFGGKGDRISKGPGVVIPEQARRCVATKQLSWDEMMEQDAAFHSNTIVGEAYANAWGLHWLLVTRYKKEYSNYLNYLKSLPMLTEVDAQERQSQFRKAFGKDLKEMYQEFQKALPTAMRRARVSLQEQKTVGRFTEQVALGVIDIQAVARMDRGGFVEVNGQMKNVSPFRDLAFYVRVLTGTGRYEDWVFPNVRSGGTKRMDKKILSKVIPGASGGISGTFLVRAKSAPINSDTAKAWQRGSSPDFGIRVAPQ